MIRKITLQNFMAHKLTVIEPAEGLTVLAGPNNCGKSAVVEALQVLAGNSGKEFMVRHGETECRIAVETSEGDAIAWRRKGSVVSYEVNGREIHRVRGSVPEEVAEKLRLNEVEGPEGKKKFAVHFGLQKEPIFLLDESGGNTATFFASFSDAARLMQMQQRHKSKVMESRAEERGLVVREGELTGRMENLKHVDEMLAGVERVEGAYGALRQEMGEAEALAQCVEGLVRQEGEVVSLGLRQRVLESLPGVPVMEEVRELEVACRRMREVGAEMEEAAGRSGVLKGLGAVPVVQETAELVRVCEEMRRRGREIEKAMGRVRVELPPVPVMDETAGLERAAAGVRAAAADMERRGVELKQASVALGEAEKAIEKWAAAHPVCPTCGTEVDAAKLIGGHVHGA